MENSILKSLFAGVVTLLTISTLTACNVMKATQTEAEEESIAVDPGTGSVPASVGAPPRDSMTPNSSQVSEIYKFLAVRDPQVLQMFPQAFQNAQSLDQLFTLPAWGMASSQGLAVPRLRFELNMESLSGSTWGANEAATGSNIRLWFEVPRNTPLLPYKMNLKNSSIREAHLTQTAQGQFSLSATFGGSAGYTLSVEAQTVRRPVPALVPFALNGRVRFALANGVVLQSGGLIGTFEVPACPVFAMSPQAASVMGCF
jgi:hypothetical protein